ncbi:MAG: HTH-type transcriptional regulator BetI [Elusimicrobia bacterium]|nr:HTH-type transcriptional regulator BetI [Elusimicrobiota bacterium]
MSRIKPADRKQKILDATRHVLGEKNYHDVKLEDVAKRAGIAKGTLYLYFRDKERLMAAVLNDIVDRLEACLALIKPSGNALDRLRAIIEQELIHFVENKDFIAQLSATKLNFCGAAAGRDLKDRFGQHIKLLCSHLEACMKEGSLRRHDTRQGALYLVSLIRMFAIYEIHEKSQKPIPGHVDDLMAFLLNGLGKKGRAHA